MVKFVENELQTIRTEINDMWTLVYQQLENAYRSVLNADQSLADKVVAREKRVNAFELKIDSDIEDFIALYNPVAIDLRFALAMLKINNNLERIGDYADSIARFVIRTKLNSEDKVLFNELQIQEMFDMVLSMLNTTYESLQKHDIGLAKSVFDKDETSTSLTRTPWMPWRHTPASTRNPSVCVWKLPVSSASWNAPATTSTTWPKKRSSTSMHRC